MRSFCFIFCVWALGHSIYGKTVLILAATGALGSEISYFLADKEYDLVIAARDKNKSDKLIHDLKSKFPHRTITFLKVDYSQSIAVDVSSLKGSHLDGVVLIPPRPTFTTNSGIPTKEEWDSVFSLNYSAPLEVLRRLECFMNIGGSVVIMCGLTSEQYMPAYQNSNVIRLAWIGALKNLMYQFAAKKIRVNAVSPAIILTEFNKEKIQKSAEGKGICFDKELEDSVANLPLKQYGEPLDVAKVVYFLLSDLSSHVNGVNLPVDGGESLSY